MSVCLQLLCATIRCIILSEYCGPVALRIDAVRRLHQLHAVVLYAAARHDEACYIRHAVLVSPELPDRLMRVRQTRIKAR